MARKKISEFAAKRVLFGFLNITYGGVSIDTNQASDVSSKLESGKKYVLKVDQGIKQRKKRGLVSFNVTKENVNDEIKKLSDKGFSHFIIEEFIEHDEFSEFYLAIERVREGKKIHYSTSGGIEIEDNKDSITSLVVKDYDQLQEISKTLQLPVEILESIATAFDEYYFSFLEINPLVVNDGKFYFLDTAVEVDSTAEFFVNGAWSSQDFREAFTKDKTAEEQAIEALKETTPAALSFNLLNPNGSIFVLLSGGGASLVTADEIYQKGMGEALANYGEYSGSPTEDETYIYVKNILSTLLRSTSHNKSIIIAGGVANFTDVRTTFRGIIKALSEVESELTNQNVKIYVRRGGPHQKEGLLMMKEYLEKSGLIGEVHGPELVLTEIVAPAIKHVL